MQFSSAFTCTRHRPSYGATWLAGNCFSFWEKASVSEGRAPVSFRVQPEPWKSAIMIWSKSGGLGLRLPPLELKRPCITRGASLCCGVLVTGENITRVDLTEAVYKRAGLTRAEAADLVEQVIEGICSTLATGEMVKLSGFGTFTVGDKSARVGRNPKTGEEVPIAPRKSITFRPSPVLEEHVNGGTRKPRLA